MCSLIHCRCSPPNLDCSINPSHDDGQARVARMRDNHCNVWPCMQKPKSDQVETNQAVPPCTPSLNSPQAYNSSSPSDAAPAQVALSGRSQCGQDSSPSGINSDLPEAIGSKPNTGYKVFDLHVASARLTCMFEWCTLSVHLGASSLQAPARKSLCSLSD